MNNKINTINMETTYKIGAHNAFSYQRPIKWWMRLFNFAARCQKWDVYTQYLNGVRLFDARVKVKNDGSIVMAHGYNEYPSKVFFEFCNEMQRASTLQDPVYIRLVLEYNKQPKNADEKIKKFVEMCSMLDAVCNKVHFFGGIIKWQWGKSVYNFTHNAPTYEDKYSSTTKPKYIDDWFPWLYAVTHNKKNRKVGTTKQFLLIDFVNYK